MFWYQNSKGFLTWIVGPTLDANVHWNFELDFDATIERARVLFGYMFQDEDFLPRAPDPEEIIIGGDDETESGLFSV